MPKTATAADILVSDLRAAGYRAFIQRYRREACIVVEDGNGRSVPRPFCGTISISYDGSRIGRMVGTGSNAYDDVTALGGKAIRETLKVGA